MISRLSLLLALFQALPSAQSLEVGDNLCVQGYVMDKFCIDAVEMIDNGKVTLEEPFTHSVHCLVDVSVCYNSHFEVLTAPTITGSNAKYSRGYRLTETSKQVVMEVARSVGSCSTCVNGYDSSKLADGFRAVMNATVLELSTDGGAGPPLIMVHNNQAYYPEPSDTDPCQTVLGLTEGTIMFNNPNVSIDDELTTDSGAMSFLSSRLVGLFSILGVVSTLQ